MWGVLGRHAAYLVGWAPHGRRVDNACVWGRREWLQRRPGQGRGRRIGTRLFRLLLITVVAGAGLHPTGQTAGRDNPVDHINLVPATQLVKHNRNRPCPRNVGIQKLLRCLARHHRLGTVGVSPRKFVRIARCESGLNPRAVGGGGLYLGLYQQHRSYWSGRARRYGASGYSAFNAWANALVSSRMMKQEGLWHWPVCRYR